MNVNELSGRLERLSPTATVSPLARCVLTALLLLLISTDGLQAQTEQLGRSLFGVPLNAKASALLAEVEQLYGRALRQEWLAEDHPMSGSSRVANDGTPVIYINPSHGRQLDVIVHELYHFKLRSRGYPVVLWLFPQTMDSEANRAAFNQLRVQLYDPILHYLLYSEVRFSFGINPGETFEKLTRRALADGSLASTFSSMDSSAIALYYFKSRLEVDDSELFHQVLALLENEQKHAGIQSGERLVRIVREAKPASPESAIDALVECLNVFYQGQFRFEQHAWTSRQLGKHTQQVAQIEINPVQ